MGKRHSITGVFRPSRKIEPPDIIFPEEYVIFTDKPLYRPDRATIHTPAVSRADQYVEGKACTLPLVFLQVAHEYTIHELIFLGLQCCSYREGDRPRCTVEELRACAEELKGHRGRRKALRAIRYLENNSRSPWNRSSTCSFDYLMLSEVAALTRSFSTKELTWKMAVKLTLPNLYVPSCKLDIEYDSEEFHSTASALTETGNVPLT